MFKKIISTTATRLITAIISLIVLWLNASILGPNGIATIGVVVLGVSLSSLISGLLGSSSLSYFVSRKSLGQLIGVSYISIIIGVCIISVLGFVLQSFPNLYFRVFLSETYFYHILILAILQSIYTNHMAVLIGKEKIFMHNLLTLSQFFSLITILVYLYTQQEKPQVNDYLIAYYSSILVPLLISGFYIITWISKDQSQKQNKGLIKEVWNFGWAVQAASLVQLINYRLPYYFLNTPSTQHKLGVFTTANQLSEGLWIFGKSVSLVQYSRITNSKDTNYNQELTLRLFKFTSLITLLGLAVVLIIPGDFFVLILKHQEYHEIPRVILLLSPGIIALVTKMIFAHYFSGTGRPNINLRASVFSLLIAIVSAFLLIPNYGITGAALTASITYLSGACILFYRFKKESKYTFQHFLIQKEDWMFFKTFISEFRSK
jgi:O-antigen/teichoic acid export membrane protein